MRNNPYVGPRPFERRDRQNFYGRQRETRDLLSLILAERVVLFYAPSGAGKTSLLNAQIVPALEEEGFNVLPAVRVGSDLPPHIDPQNVNNIFVFNALLGLAGTEFPAEALVDHTLLSFLRQLNLDENAKAFDYHPPILILDQFEELFTTHRARWQDAQGFFEQMREALREMSTLGVVFTMREDHVAELDPYAPLLPGRLRTRFRMERLGPEGALAAVALPARNAGCPFDPSVAERLVDDLRRIKQVSQLANRRADTPVLGPHVEPVQLQVVCNRLWENLPEQEDAGAQQRGIQWEEIEAFGDVDRALTDFYENALTRCVREIGVSERLLRHWFDEQLITPMKTRGLALRGETGTAGLPNEAVDILEEQHLIRAERRVGTRWYELSHDRLVDPILQSNRTWEAARETPLRIAARRWQETEDASLLYRRDALVEALAWARSNPQEVEPYETEFLEASQRAEQALIQERRRRLTVLIGIAAALLISGLAIFGFGQYQSAIAHRLTVQSRIAMKTAQEGPVRSVLLAIESLKRSPSMEGSQAVRYGLDSLPDTLATLRHGSVVWDTAVSPAGEWIATAGDNGLMRIWDAVTGEETAQIDNEGTVLAMAFSPDGRWLATGGRDNTVRVRDSTKWWGEIHQLEHDDEVNSLAFSPDGKWLATASVDGAAQVWDVETGKEVASMASGPPQPPQITVERIRATCDTLATAAFSQTFGHGFEHFLARAVTFSPDGNWLATVGNDNTARVWDTSTWEEIIQVEHDEAILAVTFSPDSKWLATASRDDTARVWEVTTGQEVAPGITHPCDVRAVDFSPDGKYLATASDDQTARIWNLATGEGIPMSHDGAVWTVTFSPDGKWLATGSLDQTARLWDLATHREVARMALGGSVWDLTFSPDSKWLVTAGWFETAKVWRVAEKKLTPRIRHGNTVVDVAFSPNGQWFAAGSWDGTVSLWETSAMPEAIRREGIGFPVWDVAFSPDSHWLALGCGDGYVRVLEVATGDIVTKMRQGEAFDVIYAVAFSHDGRWIASGSRRTARVWDATTGDELARMENEAPVSDVAFSPNDKWLATGSLKTTAQIWDTVTGEELARFQHKGQIWDVAFSPNGKWLATASEDWTARLWDVAGKRELIWWGHRAHVHEVAFSPDGRRLAAASWDGTVTVWDTAIRTRKPVATMYHEGDSVWTVAFSPDGEWLATGTRRGTVRVWNVDAEKEVFRSAHNGLITAVTFSPNGRWLATGSEDNEARIWNWRPQDLITEACSRLPHNLTHDEWRRYIGPGPYRPTCPGLPVPEE